MNNFFYTQTFLDHSEWPMRKQNDKSKGLVKKNRIEISMIATTR